MGEAPEHIVLVETEADVDALEVEDPERDRLHLADHAVGRRDARDHRPPAREVPGTSPGRAPTTSVTRPPTARPPSSRWPPQCDLVLVIGSQQLVELAAPRRRRARLRRRRAPDRQRAPGPRGVARGRARRRHLLRRERARGARRRASSTSSASAAPRTSRSSRSCARTCASCCRRRSARRWRQRPSAAEPGLHLVAVLVEPRRRAGATAAGARRRAAAAAHASGTPSASTTGSRPSASASAKASATSLIGPTGHAGGAQHLDPVRRPAACANTASSALAERVDVRHARGVGRRSARRPASSGSPIASHSRANSAVVADRDGERPVGGLVGLVRRDARVAVAAAPRARRPPSTSAEPWLSSEASARVHQRDLDVAAARRCARARRSAAWMPVTASSPQTRSTTAAPTFSGAPVRPRR